MVWPFDDDLPRSSADIPRIDGEPYSLRVAASDLRSLAGQLDTPKTAASQLESLTDGTSWNGAGFDAFRNKVEKNPKASDVANAQSIMHQAADTLTTLASGIADCQSRIDWCRQQIDNLNLPDGDIPEELRTQVQNIKNDADDARNTYEGHVRTAGNRFGDLTGQTVYAEPPPGFFERVGNALGEGLEFLGEFAIGIVEGVWEMVKGLYSIVALAVQPWKWDDAWRTFTQIAQFAWNNPGEFLKMVGKAAVDWDTLMENPGRWLGKLVPAIVLAIATGGAGAAAGALGRVATLASRFSRLSRVASTATRAASAARRVDNFANVPRRLATSGPAPVRAAVAAANTVASLPGRAVTSAARVLTGRNRAHTPIGSNIDLPQTSGDHTSTLPAREPVGASTGSGGGGGGAGGDGGPGTGAGPDNPADTGGTEPLDTVDTGGNDPGGNDPVDTGDPGGNDPADTGANDPVDTGDAGGNDPADTGANDPVDTTNTNDAGSNEPLDTGANDPVDTGDAGGNDPADTGANDPVDTGDAGGNDPADTGANDPVDTTNTGDTGTNGSEPLHADGGANEPFGTGDPADLHGSDPINLGDSSGNGSDPVNLGDSSGNGSDPVNLGDTGTTGSDPVNLGDHAGNGSGNAGDPLGAHDTGDAVTGDDPFASDGGRDPFDPAEHRPVRNPRDLLASPEFRPDPAAFDGPDHRPIDNPADLLGAPEYRPTGDPLGIGDHHGGGDHAGGDDGLDLDEPELAGIAAVAPAMARHVPGGPGPGGRGPNGPGNRGPGSRNPGGAGDPGRPGDRTPAGPGSRGPNGPDGPGSPANRGPGGSDRPGGPDDRGPDGPDGPDNRGPDRSDDPGRPADDRPGSSDDPDGPDSRDTRTGEPDNRGSDSSRDPDTREPDGANGPDDRTPDTSSDPDPHTREPDGANGPDDRAPDDSGDREADGADGPDDRTPDTSSDPDPDTREPEGANGPDDRTPDDSGDPEAGGSNDGADDDRAGDPDSGDDTRAEDPDDGGDGDDRPDERSDDPADDGTDHGDDDDTDPDEDDPDDTANPDEVINAYRPWNPDDWPWLGEVNPSGNMRNCIRCVEAVEDRLSGRNPSAVAAPGRPNRTARDLARRYGGRFDEVGRTPTGARNEIVRRMLAAGDGARGVVRCMRPNGVHHVFNVVNRNGVIHFVDGQSNGPGRFAGSGTGYDRFRFMHIPGTGRASGTPSASEQPIDPIDSSGVDLRGSNRNSPVGDTPADTRGNPANQPDPGDGNRNRPFGDGADEGRTSAGRPQPAAAAAPAAAASSAGTPSGTEAATAPAGQPEALQTVDAGPDPAGGENGQSAPESDPDGHTDTPTDRTTTDPGNEAGTGGDEPTDTATTDPATTDGNGQAGDPAGADHTNTSGDSPSDAADPTDRTDTNDPPDAGDSRTGDPTDRTDTDPGRDTNTAGADGNDPGDANRNEPADRTDPADTDDSHTGDPTDRHDTDPGRNTNTAGAGADGNDPGDANRNEPADRTDPADTDDSHTGDPTDRHDTDPGRNTNTAGAGGNDPADTGSDPARHDPADRTGDDPERTDHPTDRGDQNRAPDDRHDGQGSEDGERRPDDRTDRGSDDTHDHDEHDTDPEDEGVDMGRDDRPSRDRPRRRWPWQRHQQQPASATPTPRTPPPPSLRRFEQRIVGQDEWGDTVWDGQAYGRAMWAEAHRNITPAQRDAVLDYGGSAHTNLNRYLEATPEQLEEMGPGYRAAMDELVANMDGAMHLQPVREWLLAVRATNPFEFPVPMDQLRMGDIVHARRYLSTSLRPEPAHARGWAQVHLYLEVPPGTPGFFMEGPATVMPGLRPHLRQSELVLGRDLDYEIVEPPYQDANGRWQLRGRIIPPENPPAGPGSGPGGDLPGPTDGPGGGGPDPVDPDGYDTGPADPDGYDTGPVDPDDGYDAGPSDPEDGYDEGPSEPEEGDDTGSSDPDDGHGPDPVEHGEPGRDGPPDVANPEPVRTGDPEPRDAGTTGSPGTHASGDPANTGQPHGSRDPQATHGNDGPTNTGEPRTTGDPQAGRSNDDPNDAGQPHGSSDPQASRSHDDPTNTGQPHGSSDPQATHGNDGPTNTGEPRTTEDPQAGRGNGEPSDTGEPRTTEDPQAGRSHGDPSDTGQPHGSDEPVGDGGTDDVGELVDGADGQRFESGGGRDPFDLDEHRPVRDLRTIFESPELRIDPDALDPPDHHPVRNPRDLLDTREYRPGREPLDVDQQQTGPGGTPPGGPLPARPPREPSQWDDIADPSIADDPRIEAQFRGQRYSSHEMSPNERNQTSAFVSNNGRTPPSIARDPAVQADPINAIRTSDDNGHAETNLLWRNGDPEDAQPGDLAMAMRDAIDHARRHHERVTVRVVINRSPCGPDGCARTIGRYVTDELPRHLRCPDDVSESAWRDAMRNVDIEVHAPHAYEGQAGPTTTRDLLDLEDAGVRVTVYQPEPGVYRPGNPNNGQDTGGVDGAGGEALNDTMRYLDEYRDSNGEVPVHWTDVADLSDPDTGTPASPRGNPGRDPGGVSQDPDVRPVASERVGTDGPQDLRRRAGHDPLDVDATSSSHRTSSRSAPARQHVGEPSLVGARATGGDGVDQGDGDLAPAGMANRPAVAHHGRSGDIGKRGADPVARGDDPSGGNADSPGGETPGRGNAGSPSGEAPGGGNAGSPSGETLGGGNASGRGQMPGGGNARSPGGEAPGGGSASRPGGENSLGGDDGGGSARHPGGETPGGDGPGGRGPGGPGDGGGIGRGVDPDGAQGTDHGTDAVEADGTDGADRPGGTVHGGDGDAGGTVPNRQPVSPAELELRSRPVIDAAGTRATGRAPLRPIDRDLKGGYDSYIVTFADGSEAVYKPASGEPSFMMSRTIPKGGTTQREVATARLSEDLGLELVPTTTPWDGPLGRGSLQVWVEGTTPGRPPAAYEVGERQRMAVLDYISGNTDRSPRNYRTGPTGRLVAVDHTSCFPEGPADDIMSSFVVDQFGEKLSQDIVDHLQTLDLDHVRRRLLDSGLREPAVDGAMARLIEVRTRGRITGEAWDGRIVDASLRVKKEARA